MAGMPPSRRAIVTAVVTVLASLVAIGIYAWRVLGDLEMSLAGYLALAFGVIATVALGVGLMALLFYSNRQGYDDRLGTPPDRHDRRD